jgi:hypothetical protein
MKRRAVAHVLDLEMTESSSATTFVVGDRLPWGDENSSPEEKGPFDAGTIFADGSRQPCSIRKISALGAMVESGLSPALGERVAVELGTGQRPAGRVAWNRNGELGVRFDDNVDVVALLNRQLVSQARERRTMPRLEVRCAAHIKWGEHLLGTTLRNISARGLQLEGDGLPAVGSYVSVFVDGLNIPAGEVVWARNGLVGIEIFEELSWSSIIPWVRDVIRKGVN